MQPGTPVQPAPTQTTSQGVASLAPNAQPSAPQLPAAPQVAATPAPVAAPNLNTAQTIGQIGDYYNIPRQTTQVVNAGNTAANIASSQFEHQKAENQIDIQNKQNSLDPSKYQFSKNADGSVDILNSVGDKVDIGTYAALTGDNPATALQKAGATDQASQKFIAAYNNLQSFVQTKIAAQNGDEQANVSLGEYYKANPGLQNLELGQLQSAFMQQYGQYFGQPQGNQNALQQAGVTPTLTSRNSYTASSPYYAATAYGVTGETNPYASSVLGGGGGTSGLVSQLSSNSTGGV